VFLVVASQSRILQLLTLAWPARCMGSWEGTQLGQLIQIGQRGILLHTMSCSVYKLGELPRGQQLLLGDTLGIIHLVFTFCPFSSHPTGGGRSQ